MNQRQRHDPEKQRRWERIIAQAARSGLSTREFCRQRGLHESQFYWWQRTLKKRQQASRLRRRPRSPSDGQARFALVSDEPGALAAGIELILANGRRLRIGQGVDEETLRTVLAALESASC